MTVRLKDPDEVLQVSLDWADEDDVGPAGVMATGETISTSAWAVEGGDGELDLGAPPTKTITAITIHTDGTRPDQISATGHGFGAGDAISIVGTSSTPSVVGAATVLAASDLDHFTLDDGTGTAVAFTVGGAQANASAALSILTDTVAATWISAGTKGQVYSVRNRVTTTQGRTLDRVVIVRMESR